jgi:hypothetical protein
MRADAIRRAADLLGVPYRGPQHGWMTLGCPFAPTHHKSGIDRNPSMRVEVKNGGVSRWRCWSCGQGGSLGEIAAELQAIKYAANFGQLFKLFGEEQDELGITILGADADDPDSVPDAPPVIPQDYLDAYKHVWVSAAGHGYLKQRGITLAQMQAWDLRYDAGRQRVVFPIRDFGGGIRGAQGRTILKDVKPKYLHYAYPDEIVGGKQVGKVYGHHFWYGEDKIDFDQCIVVVEGPTDTIATAEVYPNTVGACGSAVLMPAKLERLSPAAKIVTFLDPDDAGDIGRERIQQWCYKKRLCLHARPPKGRDPGSLDPQEIAELLWPLVTG